MNSFGGDFDGGHRIEDGFDLIKKANEGIIGFLF